ncbi:MAG: GNAT family N-acetyltransferase [Gemmatimonadaceae bacterium]|nr:GNAT family N-acetyltransferase [Gemmatimonadaceae bacterium]
MSTTDPWITLGRDHARCLAAVQLPTHEAWVALDADDAVAGFVLLVLQGAFIGYIRSIAVRADLRSRGVGRALLDFAERRSHRESPNVFLCVSSFNSRARALYERYGFALVGELTDFVVAGHSEWLMRKSIAPITGYTPPPDSIGAP